MFRKLAAVLFALLLLFTAAGAKREIDNGTRVYNLKRMGILCEGLFRFAGILAHACENAEALRLDEDLAFLAFLASYFIAVGIIGS